MLRIGISKQKHISFSFSDRWGRKYYHAHTMSATTAGKVVIVTGGASGIGAHLVKRFLESGYKVATCDLQPCASHNNNKDLFTALCDISKEDQVKAFIEGTAKAFADAPKPFLCLINNAAIANPYMPMPQQTNNSDDSNVLQQQPPPPPPPPSLENLDIDALRKFLEVNVIGQALMMKHCAKYLLSSSSDDKNNSNSGGGSIINISSTRASMSEPNSEGYAASKGALESLTHAVAVTNSGRVRCNAVRVGWINATPNYEPTGEDHKFHLSGRVGQPEDIFHLCEFLASAEKSGFIDGAVIPIEGGVTKKMIYPE